MKYLLFTSGYHGRLNRLFYLLAILILPAMAVKGQNEPYSGKAIAEIFTDFHISINDTTKHTGFGINRAYLGYQFLPAGNLSAKLIVNIGSPDDLASGNKHHRYAFFREASLTWSEQKVTITMGITSTKLFEFQQQFWGKRYIANTYQSINGYGFVADLGITAEYRMNDKIKAELIIMNGEGYNDIQVDDNIRTSAALTFTPSKTMVLRILGDIQKTGGLWQPLGLVFAGFKNDHLTIGGEVTYKSNIDIVKGHHAWGISATAAVKIAKDTELFTRFDYSASVTVPGESRPWNYLRNSDLLIVGLQQTLSPNVKVALDYQGTIPYSSEVAGTDLIYFNALFKF